MAGAQRLKADCDRLYRPTEVAELRYIEQKPPRPPEAYAGAYGLLAPISGGWMREYLPTGKVRLWGWGDHWREAANFAVRDPNKAECIRRAEVMDAYYWACRDLERSCGLTGAMDAYEAALASLADMEDRILSLPVKSMRDVSLQVQILREGGSVAADDTPILSLFERIEHGAQVA